VAYSQNDHINRRLFDAIMQAQIAHEMGGISRREFIRRERRKALGAMARTLDRVLKLDDAQMDRFFEKVCREYGV
jgi:uncharacterized protein YjgD (DUF1641 family)